MPCTRRGFGDILGRETARREWPGGKALAAAVRGESEENTRNELQFGAFPGDEGLLGHVRLWAGHSFCSWGSGSLDSAELPQAVISGCAMIPVQEFRHL